MTYYHRIPSPLGDMLLLSDGTHLQGAYFARQKYHPAPDAAWQAGGGLLVLRDAERQLREYFAGRRTVFDLPLRPIGTDFQQRVWRALMAIPYGSTYTYGKIAADLGGAPHARAVGSATGRNPISVIVPCHRVLGHSGGLTGYAGGLERKRALLALEAASVPFALSAA